MLKEIRIHGRGGQGVVTMGELIAAAAYIDGKEVQAFPSFGVERRGAPVESFVRISTRPILRRDQIINPDYLIILDETLLKERTLYRGLDKGDVVVINSRKKPDEVKKYFKIYPDIHIFSLDATTLALEVLGKPIVNTALLGAFAAATKIIKLEAVQEVIKNKFKGEVAEKNVLVVKCAFDHTNPRSQFLLEAGKQDVAVYDREKMRVTS